MQKECKGEKAFDMDGTYNHFPTGSSFTHLSLTSRNKTILRHSVIEYFANNPLLFKSCIFKTSPEAYLDKLNFMQIDMGPPSNLPYFHLVYTSLLNFDIHYLMPLLESKKKKEIQMHPATGLLITQFKTFLQ